MKKLTPTASTVMKEIIAHYHPYKDWKMDPEGYVLIRIFQNKLELGFCKKDNVILLKITGDTAEEVYNTFVREGITLRPEHFCYLGKELEKAEIAMKLKIPYVQDDPLLVTPTQKKSK